MAKLGRYGTTAGENLQVFGPAEKPSQVDDRIREIAADIAVWLRDAAWTDYAQAYSQGSNSFTVAGDERDLYFIGRNVRARVAGLPVYATISNVSYNATSDETFVVCNVEPGETLAGASEIALETIPTEEARAPSIPSGTRMVFAQATAPTGWTQVTELNDRLLRIVSGAGGGTGGDWAISGISVDETTLTEDQIPEHYHYLFTKDGSDASAYQMDAPGNGERHVADHASHPGDQDYTMSAATTGDSPTLGRTSTVGSESAAGHTHSVSTGSDWRPSYADVIVCEKD